MPYSELVVGGALAASIAVVVYGLGWLTKAGAGLGGAFGAHVILVGGWAWALPLAVFVASGSLLARLDRSAEKRVAAPRTAAQVLANGGVAWMALIALPYVESTTAYLAFVGALATATADTWGTEVGTRWNTRAWSLATGQWEQAGASGAVSGSGTAAGALGAGVIASLAATVGPVSWSVAAWIAIAGVAGSAADSLLGAFVQAQYAYPGSNCLHDTPAVPSDSPVRGIRLLTNSGVNALATCTGAGLAVGGSVLI